MKTCPTCHRTYADETLIYCLDDGSTLSAPYDPPVTRRLPVPRSTDPAPTEVLYPVSKPALPPTIPAAQLPPYSKHQPLQSKAKSGHRTGLIFGVGALLGVLLAVGIAVSFLWLGKEDSRDNQSHSNGSNTNAPVSNTNAPPQSTPSPTVSVVGRWSGSWENTLGRKSTSIIRIAEETGGLITGDEDGWVIENGSRRGNVLTWEYHNINNGCRDYQVRLEISANGKVANGTYEVRDRCEQKNYRGSYIDYKKQ